MKIKDKINKAQNSMENLYFDSFNAFKNAKIVFENLSIFQMNVRGINNPKKYDKIKILLSQLDTKFDIIVLGETKLKQSFPSGIYNLNGYERYNCCRDAKNSGGGLMVFIRKDILVKMVIKESTTFEKIKIIINVRKTDFKILSYYRNPVQQSLDPFLNDLEQELLENHKNTVVIGDVNLDSNADNKESERYVTLMKSFDVEITNTIKTRNESGRIIDHCAINFQHMTIVKNYTVSTRLSDHNIIMSELANIKKEKVEKIIEMEVINWKKLCAHFGMLQSRSEIMNEVEPNEIAKQLTEMTKESIKIATKKN